MKNEKFEKSNGFKTLFKDNSDEKEEENMDTKWILDILGEDKESPTKPIDDVSDEDTKDVSSKEHLKSLFSNSNFTTSKFGISSKQVVTGTSKKLNFEPIKSTNSSRKKLFVNENTKKECLEQTVTKVASTPAPAKLFKKSLSQTYDKETIYEVSRRLKDELIENINSPSKTEYKNLSKNIKDWEKYGFEVTMK
jgi:hypothetical protein